MTKDKSHGCDERPERRSTIRNYYSESKRSQQPRWYPMQQTDVGTHGVDIYSEMSLAKHKHKRTRQPSLADDIPNSQFNTTQLCRNHWENIGAYGNFSSPLHDENFRSKRSNQAELVPSLSHERLTHCTQQSRSDIGSDSTIRPEDSISQVSSTVSDAHGTRSWYPERRAWIEKRRPSWER